MTKEGEMSLIWKKFRKTGGGGSLNDRGHVEDGAVAKSPSHGGGGGGASSNRGLPGTAPSSPHQSSYVARLFISAADEQLFMTDLGDGMEDPLLVESQFVKTVTDIFSSQSTLPYFMQFLQGWGSDKYARFWLDVMSFKGSAETRIHSHSSQVPQDKKVGGNESLMQCNEDNHGKVKKEGVCKVGSVNVENCMQSSLHDRTLIKSDPEKLISPDKVLVLPDLVSNIKYATDVTPLNSPDGPSSNIQNFDSSFSRNVKDELAKGVPSNQTKDECSHLDNSALRSTVKEDCNVMHSNTWTCSRAQKLRQSIADDALRIFQKYLSKDAEHAIDVDDSTRQNICQKIHVVEQQDISPDCFDSAQAVVFTVMEKEYLPKFLASDYYLKHQIDVLTSGSVRLADILYSDSALPYFMEYVEQEGGRSMLQFWVAASNFRQQLKQDVAMSDPIQAQSDAMVLYDKYFSLQATCPLGFSDNVRFVVEGNICCEEGPSHLCFDLPLRTVLYVLERDFLMGYLSSSLHIKYLSELINTVKTSVELLGRKKRSGSESTCSSEQSSNQGISAQNTLLAMDSSAPHRFRNLDDPTLTMRIDEAQITDPDSLWRRKNFSKMSCGFINELGRFESDLQPEPDRKTESKISRTLKKFVNMDEDKVKEDMAYRVAEMIIKDVTNITLGSQQSSTRSSVGSSAPPLSPSSVSQDNLSDVFPS